MSEEPYTLDDLRVRPWITPKKTLMVKARFNCPLCGESIEMAFSKEDLKALIKGFEGRVYPR